MVIAVDSVVAVVAVVRSRSRWIWWCGRGGFGARGGFGGRSGFGGRGRGGFGGRVIVAIVVNTVIMMIVPREISTRTPNTKPYFVAILRSTARVGIVMTALSHTVMTNCRILPMMVMVVIMGVNW